MLRDRGDGDVDAGVEHGAAKRVRPKMMTVTGIMAGLLPILWAGGADVPPVEPTLAAGTHGPGQSPR